MFSLHCIVRAATYDRRERAYVRGVYVRVTNVHMTVTLRFHWRRVIIAQHRLSCLALY